MQFAQADADQSYIKQNALNLNLKVELPETIFEKVRAYKVIAIGEMHGTQEAPLFTFGLLSLLSKFNANVLLGLEIDHASQNDIDRFLVSGDLDILRDSLFFQRKYQDGRSSKAMVELLLNVRKLKNVKVLCFDPVNVESGQDRDSKMALKIRNYLDSNRPDVALLLTGNVHASMSIGMPWDSQYRPMVYELYNQTGATLSQTDILAIKLRYQIGSAWVCMDNDSCGVTKFNEVLSDYSEAVDWESYFLAEPKITSGYNSTIFVRTMSPSFPFLQ
jgi:hypothetical protein